jgi:hypothetical protein
MLFAPKNHFYALTLGILMALFAAPSNVLAETPHVVNPAELQNSAVTATQMRQQNIQKVRNFLSSPVAQKELKSAQIDPVQVKNAVSSLNDQELAQLASRADKAQTDFAAGRLSTEDIALIVLGVAVIILIIVVAS